MDTNYMTSELRYKTDRDYMKTFYPPMAREILAYVSEVCDREEYEGSPMFDEFPDKVYMWKMADDVYQMAEYLSGMYRPVFEEDEDYSYEGHCTSCRGTDDWLKNLIHVLLTGEMTYRRQRYFHRMGNSEIY